MTHEEIHEKIILNNKIISDLFDPSSFVLNEKVKLLQEENLLLQKKCKHNFKDGVCIYCLWEEKDG